MARRAASLRNKLAWFALLYAGGVAVVAIIAACFHILMSAVPH